MRRLLSLIILVCFYAYANGQSQQDIGVELQVYPTGLIPGITYEFHTMERYQLYLRFGANIFDHRDLGFQEKESGFGLGFSFGMKRFFKASKSAWRFGFKHDLWWNTVDWENPSFGGNTTGQTKIIVYQPTFELSYVWRKNKTSITPSIALGREWNIKTTGQETGQGTILLLGVLIGQAF